jgi:hypothetical protein
MQSSLAVAGMRDTDPAETLHVEAVREHKPLIQFGFWADWHVEPTWNLRNAARLGLWRQVKSVEAFLRSDDKVLVCTHATFRFAVDQFGVEAFDHRLIAVSPRLGQPRQQARRASRAVHRARPRPCRGDDRLSFPGRRRGGAGPAGPITDYVCDPKTAS